MESHQAGSGTGGSTDFYQAETDLWTLVSRIAAGRKARELDPATAALRQCVEMCRDDKSVDPVVQLASERCWTSSSASADGMTR